MFDGLVITTTRIENPESLHPESWISDPVYLAPMWMFLVSLLLTLGYTALLLWYRWAWRRLQAYQPAVLVDTPDTRVTVVIPARNEEANISACLHSLLWQDYPVSLLQILVVDDSSTDGTVGLVEDLMKLNPHIQCLRLLPEEATSSHKKRAIEKGIGASTGELIITTDADCRHGTRWISTLVSRYRQGGVDFIAAPVVYRTEPTVLSVFQTLDFMTLQGITGASVSQRFHTMCNGANLAYSREVFLRVGGFAGIDELPTGDDMLLMYKIYRKNPDGVVWLKSREATVETDACPNWGAFFQQRIRWASKAAFYDDRRMFWVLLGVYGFNAWCLVLGIMAILGAAPLGLLFGVIGIKTLSELAFLLPVARFFGKLRYMGWFAALQPVHILYTLTAGWLGHFGSYAWKGRRVERPAKLKEHPTG